MGHGGSRKGAGRKAGGKNRPCLQLEREQVEVGKRLTAAERMRQLRRTVALAVAAGMDEAKIAAVTRIDVAKLRACFSHELAHGKEIVLLDELLRLDEASGSGKVAASKIILESRSKGAAPADGSTSLTDRNDRVRQHALQILKGGKP